MPMSSARDVAGRPVSAISISVTAPRPLTGPAVHISQFLSGMGKTRWLLLLSGPLQNGANARAGRLLLAVVAATARRLATFRRDRTYPPRA